MRKESDNKGIFKCHALDYHIGTHAIELMSLEKYRCKSLWDATAL